MPNVCNHEPAILHRTGGPSAQERNVCGNCGEVIYRDGERWTIHPPGIQIEGERAEDRNTEFHKRIVKTEPIPNTRSGKTCTLECGHVVKMFGNIELAGGVALCMRCRDQARAQSGTV